MALQQRRFFRLQAVDLAMQAIDRAVELRRGQSADQISLGDDANELVCAIEDDRLPNPILLHALVSTLQGISHSQDAAGSIANGLHLDCLRIESQAQKLNQIRFGDETRGARSPIGVRGAFDRNATHPMLDDELGHFPYRSRTICLQYGRTHHLFYPSPLKKIEGFESLTNAIGRHHTPEFAPFCDDR